MSRTALVAGATGLVGNACLQLLLNAPEYAQVKAVVRHPLSLQHPKLETIIADFDRLDEIASHLLADDVFYCLGTTIKKAGSQESFRKIDYDYTLILAKLALQNGCWQFLLVSSLGADAQSAIFYSRVKGELENALQKLPFSAIHVFQPSILLGARKEQRIGESIGQLLARCLNPFLLGSLRKYRGIAAEAVAKAMIKSALQDKTGTFVYVSDEIQAIATA